MKKMFMALLFSILIALAASAEQRLSLEPMSQLWLEGDSSLHPYLVFAKEFALAVELGPLGGETAAPQKALQSALGQQALKQLTLTVLVAKMKSKDIGLDKKMYKALGEDQHPTIAFRAERYHITAHDAEKKIFQLQIPGVLSVAGHDNSAEVRAALEVKGDQIIVRGEHLLRMTDFGITPPTAMLGMLKTKDEIRIHFEIVLTRKGRDV